MAKNNNTDTNVFGLQSNTAGQNVIRKIINVDLCKENKCNVGILECDYPRLLKIFSAALDPIQFEIMRRGFGILCPRESQKEMAPSLGLDTNEVSKIANRAVERLQSSPFKTQIKNLQPGVTLVNELISELLDDRQARFNAEELAYRYENMAKTADAEKAAKESALAQVGRLEHDNEVLNRKVEELGAELARVTAKHVQQAMELEIARRTTAVYESAFSSIATATHDALRSIDQCRKEMKNSLQSLGLSMSTKSALEKVGIKDIESLCKLSQHALNRLGLGKYVPEIKTALKKAGLNLAA